MTVKDLKALLEDCDEQQEVRIMTQQNYPLENECHGVWQWEATKEPEEGDDDKIRFEPSDRFDKTRILYLVEGHQLGYGTDRAWREAEAL